MLVVFCKVFSSAGRKEALVGLQLRAGDIDNRLNVKKIRSCWCWAGTGGSVVVLIMINVGNNHL